MREVNRQVLVDLINGYCEADMDYAENLAGGIVDFVAEWLARYGDGAPDPEYDPEIKFGGALNPSETRDLIAAWRKDMGGE
jgi:hypothetical protein